MSSPMRFFLGVDTAPAQSKNSDDGAAVVLAAQLKNEEINADDETASFYQPGDFRLGLVYARKVRNASARQWSGIIHGLERAFGFSRMVMDHGGGGQWVKAELRNPVQNIEGQDVAMTPICTADDMSVVQGKFILVMFNRGERALKTVWPSVTGDDVLADCAHTAFRTALEHREIALPYPRYDPNSVHGWSEERRWALRLLTVTLPAQLLGICVATKDDGETWALTRNNARQYSSRGKKDFVSAMIMAYAAFLCWCHGAGPERSLDREDEAMCV